MTDDRSQEAVLAQYASGQEMGRLSATPKGTLTRLRTWDLFDRFLPAPPARVLDIGGGPGIHASRLARRGYAVELLDPVRAHVDQARAISAALTASGPIPPFESRIGDACSLPYDDASADAALLMGPLYHLRDRDDRATALREAYRTLRPGGRLLAEVVTRHAWLLDATSKGRLGEPQVWIDVEANVTTGASEAEGSPIGGFFGYFHRLDELVDEVAEAGFVDIQLVAVEGWAWLLGDLANRLSQPADLLRALQLTEAEPSMLGVSPHVMALATRA